MEQLKDLRKKFPIHHAGTNKFTHVYFEIYYIISDHELFK